MSGVASAFMACRASGKKKAGRNTTGLLNGGARRDRTADLLHAMQALSQLSYGPISCRSCITLDKGAH